MDWDVERIKVIRDNYGMECCDVPTFFFRRDEKDSIVYNINIEMSQAAKNGKDINICVNHLLLVMYYILDAFAQQGLHPNSLLEILIYDYLQKIWPDGKIHYDDEFKIVYPPDYRSVDKDYDHEVLDMMNGKYQLDDKKISFFYQEIKKIYEASRYDYSKIPVTLPERSIFDYQYKLSYLLEEYSNSDYVEEEAERLTKCLYTVLSVFVEMGVNPEMYLEELINKMEEKSFNRKRTLR